MHNSGTHPFLRNLKIKIKNISKRKLIKNWVSCWSAPRTCWSSGDGVAAPRSRQTVGALWTFALWAFALWVLRCEGLFCEPSTSCTETVQNAYGLVGSLIVLSILAARLLSGGYPNSGFQRVPSTTTRNTSRSMRLIDDSYLPGDARNFNEVTS